jgi:glycerophosphoryl diester phosphodiesterase
MAHVSGTTSGRAGPPLIIGHRGASADAPEHTIAAFELALAQGADGIALEVHLSRDRQPVVIHDFTLERTTSGAGLVAEHTVRDLKRLDAGAWRGAAFRGQRVQMLQEVFERFRGRTRFWIELRGGSSVYEDIEERVVSLLEIYDVLDGALVQSFDSGALEEVRRLNREVRVGMLVAQPLDPASITMPLDAVTLRADVATEAALAAVRDAGLEAYTWTVDNPEEVDRHRAWGATGIITDRPAVLKRQLA